MTTKTNQLENKRFGLSARARKALCGAFLAGGLFGGQAAQASVPAIPERVAAVRAEMNKRVAQIDGAEAIQKLPFAQLQLASWLNWVNWPNWNNWRDWNNWRNWSNWANWLNY